MPDSPIAQGNSLPPLNEPRLESWGEIALYLKRDIRTAQRWEKYFGLPVRRIKIGKQGQVYAFRSELEKWILERQPKPEDEKVVPEDEPGDAEEANETNASNPTVRTVKDKDEVIAPSPPKSEPHVWKWLAAGVGVLAILVFAALIIFPGSASNRFSRTGKILLFVRPFASLGSSDDQQLFVEGLTQETIVQIGKLDPAHLGVFGPSTSKECLNCSLQKLRESLAADYVLEGSVRLSDNRLRIDATLISTRDQNQVWANSYTGDQHDALKLQDKITSDVAKEIAGALPSFPGHLIHGTTRADSEAYVAYSAGRVYWLDRDLHRSLAAYQKALGINPNYAPALAGLATNYLLLGETPNDVMPPDVAIPKARQAAEQALAIDPTLADALCVLANIAQGYDHKLPEAEQLFKKAIESDPSNVTAHEWYGNYLIVTNRTEEAEAEIKRALEIDPASPLLNTTYAELKYYQRNYDGVITQAKKTLQDYPGFILAHFWLGSAYREKRMFTEAIQEFHLARQESNDNPCMVLAEGNALGLSGNKAGARKALAELETMRGSRYVPALYFAGIYEGLGDREQAFHWLEEAYRERNDRLPYLGVDPMADPLRNDPRFQDLMKKVGLPAALAAGIPPAHAALSKSLQ
jgi:TolB-like protein/Flp pilus assembly protein TadD